MPALYYIVHFPNSGKSNKWTLFGVQEKQNTAVIRLHLLSCSFPDNAIIASGERGLIQWI